MNEIEEAGFKDTFVGTELFRALNVPPWEFSADPIKMQKFKTIASFLNEHPDPGWVIQRLKNNKTNMSPLDFLASYSVLGQQKAEYAKKLKESEDEMKKYE